MIDISNLTSEERRELRIALGCGNSTSRKKEFWEEVYDELRFIKAQKTTHPIGCVRTDRAVLKDIMLHLTALTDFVTRNYGTDRRFAHFGRHGAYGVHYGKYEDNYKKFARGVVDLIKKHYIETEWDDDDTM
ncbi:MAG: hypothetical protein LIR46_00610 [Bacteroidota bacterium]|nr:hypothetical protein [Bacteroidota bacterium]